MTDDAAIKTEPLAAPVKPPSSGLDPPQSSTTQQNGGGTTYNVEKMDMRTYGKHVSLWVDPYLSGKYLLVLLLVLYYTGSNGYSLGGFIALLLIERTIIVFGFNYAGELLKAKENGMLKRVGEGLSKTGELVRSWTELPDQKRISFWTEGIGTYAEMKLSGAFSALQKAETDIRMCQVVLAHLFGFLVAFSLFSLRTIVLGGLLFGLTVPAAYSKNQERIDPLLEKLHEQAKPHIEKMTAKGKELAEKAKAQIDDNVQKAMKKVQELRKPKVSEEEATKKVN